MAIDIQTIMPGASRLGEGAVWDVQDQKLWWVDITGGLIYCYDPEQNEMARFEFGEPVGCLARREKGGLVVAAKSGFWLFDPETGKKQHISDPEADKPSHRFNDGTVDYAGRFWAGTRVCGAVLQVGYEFRGYGHGPPCIYHQRNGFFS
jgi:L-arabinonolactonase